MMIHFEQRFVLCNSSVVKLEFAWGGFRRSEPFPRNDQSPLDDLDWIFKFGIFAMICIRIDGLDCSGRKNCQIYRNSATY